LAVSTGFVAEAWNVVSPANAGLAAIATGNHVVLAVQVTKHTGVITGDTGAVFTPLSTIPAIRISFATGRLHYLNTLVIFTNYLEVPGDPGAKVGALL
jgi:hypothetical protein